jgi:putative transposase
MDWKTLLAYISGSVDEELLLRNAYLVAENRILRDQIKGRIQLSDAERLTLSEIGRKLGKKALEEVAHIVKPDTILAWQRKLTADTFDGSSQRKLPGRRCVEIIILRYPTEIFSVGCQIVQLMQPPDNSNSASGRVPLSCG